MPISCLSVNKSGHLMACDSGNNRIQVFELSEKFVGKFGTKSTNLGEFNSRGLQQFSEISRSEIHQGTGASFKILTNRLTDTTI